jgi:phosphatidate cytidylyltransferase
MVVAPVSGLLALLAGRELARILRAKGVRAAPFWSCGLALGGVVLAAFMPVDGTAFVGASVVNSAIALVFVGSLVYYAGAKQTEGMVAAAGGALLSFVYVGLMLGFLTAIRRENSAWLLAWVLLTTKLADIGAYTVGRAFGRHKLIPWVSPGKTWEGFVGALVFAGLLAPALAVGLTAMDVPGVPGLWACVLMGVVLAGVGHAGDLVASMLKRDAGRKDAGASVPGFGGVLDVLDSVLLAGPVAFWLLRIL